MQAQAGAPADDDGHQPQTQMRGPQAGGCAPSTGEHGVSVQPAGGLLVFRWGGAELLRMPRAAFVRYGATPAEMS